MQDQIIMQIIDLGQWANLKRKNSLLMLNDNYVLKINYF